MAIVTLAALGLLLMGVVVLLGSIVTAGRAAEQVVVPAGLTDQARSMRARAHVRVALSAGAAMAGGVAGLVGVLMGDRAGDWGQVVWVVAFLAAAGAGCVVASLVGPRQQSAPRLRSADLTPRTARSFGPRWALTAPAVVAGVLAAAMVAAAMTATEVDGSATLAWSGPAGVSGSVGPYPGWSTVLPLLALLLAVGAAFVVALRRIASWPRPTDRGLFGLDDDIRRASTRMLLVATAGALFGALGAFGYEVALTWGVALVNERINSSPSGTDPALAESVWNFLTFVGASLVVVGFALMACAPLAGRVRRPLIDDRVAAPGRAKVGE